MCIVLLVVFGIAANFLCSFILNIAGLPGALLAGMPGTRSPRRFILGSLVSAFGQSYAYLAFVAFVTNWTNLAAKRDDVVGLPLWPVAFLTCMVPIYLDLIRSRIEAREHPHANAQVEALHLTVPIAFVVFFIFAFFPAVMRVGWGWLPYMSKG